MRALALPLHPGLADGTRLRWLAQPDQRLKATELLLLLSAGVVAALASAFLDFGLKIPGHAIIRAVFPMALGFAAAPRRMAGTTMGASALATALVLNFTVSIGGRALIGAGAMTSLVLTGPLLDVALWRARRGWQLYASFALAGLASNLVALSIRAVPKLMNVDHAIGRPLAIWFPRAIVSYTLCGVFAGLISALVWFQFTAKRKDDAATEPSA